MNPRRSFVFLTLALVFARALPAQTSPANPSASPAVSSPAPGDTAPARGPRTVPADSNAIAKLSAIRAQDVCILPDPVSKTYYMIASGFNGVREWTSQDLIDWQGSKTIFRTPPDIWGSIRTIGVWAPEMHSYKGKYYLFLTFNTQNPFPEQWRQWRPRVTRGSQVLVGDSPEGPFKPFQNHATTPVDMMTLDGTLWVEDGVPYMVFAHEWVQITNGTIEAMPLKDDLSEAAGEPKRLFAAQSAKWSEPAGEGGWVTDGPYLHRGKTGKLYLIWSSRNHAHGYVLGVAISDSGKLAGPWRQEPEPIFQDNGGHGMIFQSFDGKLLMVLHAPDGRGPHPLLFEIEDTGETLRIVRPFAGQ
ncbi:MAG TPA: glycoside hydrolase family 43 protein [Opitutaceae bacterium]|nr:glycoside hydrolase family 43 protein [Opitutaceae bacterium]